MTTNLIGCYTQRGVGRNTGKLLNRILSVCARKNKNYHGAGKMRNCSYFEKVEGEEMKHISWVINFQTIRSIMTALRVGSLKGQ